MANNKMTKAQVLKTVKDNVMTNFTDILETLNAEQVGDYAYAIPTEVDGNERWAVIEIKAKDVITDDNGDRIPYDPFVEIQRWESDKADKAERKAERERKHAETVKRAEERRAKAKAKAEAKKTATAAEPTE